MSLSRSSADIRYVRNDSVMVRSSPAIDASPETELLCNQPFVVLRDRDGWAYGSAPGGFDHGYLPSEALTRDHPNVTHQVQLRSVQVYPSPSFKQEAVGTLGLNTQVALHSTEVHNGFVELASRGWLFFGSLLPLGERPGDLAFYAEKFFGQPYRWGGTNAAQGADCSGVVMAAHFAATGEHLPHSANRIARLYGKPVALSGKTVLRRNDLVCWNGHVAVVMESGDDPEILHTTVDVMRTYRERLSSAQARRTATRPDPYTVVRR